MAEAVARLAEPLAASLKLVLWGVEVLPGGSVVRVFVESTEDGQGTDIDQCAHLSRLLGLALDVEDCIPGAYTLEVSSPGLERRFFTAAQLAGAVGKHVEITLFSPLPEFPLRRKFVGELRAAPAGEAAASAAQSAAQAAAVNAAQPAAQGLFVLATEDTLLPDEEPPLVSFSFAQLRKARQVHFVPEKPLPGKKKGKPGEKKAKPGEKKTKPGTKAKAAPGGENAAAAESEFIDT